MLKSLKSAALAAALLFVGAAVSAGEEAKPAAPADEATLIAVLKSEAGIKEKCDACRELARIGTKAAVPTLAALLGDAKLSHMARYALEPIPDPAADEALREALGKVKGLRLVGVIGSIGVRRDAKATEALTRLLQDPDREVAQGAARALGSIGTPEAAAALEAALPKVPAANQVAFCEGLFRCAEALAKDQREKAMAIYDKLRALQPAPQQVRAGALSGAVLTRGKEGIPMLVAAIKGEDYVLTEAAARTAIEMPFPEVTKAITDELGKLPPDTQVLMTLTLGKRGDAAAVPALLALTQGGDKAVRVAAIRALPEIGSAAAVPGLAALMGDAEKEVAAAAQDALSALPGKEADAAVVAMLDDKDPKARAVAIGLLAERRVASAAPALLKMAEDPDEAIRLASIKTLGELAGPDDLPALIGLLVKAKGPAESKAAENALSGICNRLAVPATGTVVIVKAVYGVLPDGPSVDVTAKVAEMVKAGATAIEASNGNFGDPANGKGKRLRVEYTLNGRAETKTVDENDTITLTGRVAPPAVVDALCAALPQAPLNAKLALLRILRSAGSPKALDALRAAMTDANAEVKDAATSILCEWPTPEVLPELTQLAKTGTSPKTKILALRGLFRLIPLQEAPVEQKLAALKDAMALAERVEEKRLALAALGAIPSPDSLALVVAQLSSPNLKEEACQAAVAIAEKIVKSHPAQVAEALGEVVKETANKQLARKAGGLLQQARRAAPRK